ncbi:hypothetical protein EDC58_0773 [Caminibacter pacificus]|uniref:Uncharacterized protein n=1 Tax=Caminibacter pacificus TaxID=1424653 RepID=A0AAJ4UXL1_9BACT|nr:hypothetical protein EDC58_0773 [Caminibacter pacificus]
MSADKRFTYGFMLLMFFTLVFLPALKILIKG